MRALAPTVAGIHVPKSERDRRTYRHAPTTFDCARPWGDVSITGLVARRTGESASIPVPGHANGDSLDAGTKASQPLDSWHFSRHG
ncbi:predicted protein [Pyrenophora tritici-repentis Pt-1C-BFP]|uniref:Uncharacterized protein n=1 Tax=Pyrenophora tritici-repentis (strain Pt-1C-BFP) TaxID=426418 RepID=B2VT49_PYRTR|nr:uncharacterized protein PTRG_01885 [Pyrenophora tritici-repentis Pt-1C-BFP]EDU41323.1 predicted protein [Pyrenophora tritici-repentis Pt-1C-BFP]